MSNSQEQQQQREQKREQQSLLSEDVQITCIFVTKISIDALKLQPTKIQIPGKLTRYGLSETVHYLLEEERLRGKNKGLEADVANDSSSNEKRLKPPFDFFIDDALLRTSVAKLAHKLKKSAEQVLVIEYALAVLPPVELKRESVNEWVSSVKGSWSRALCVGSYDGVVRMYGRGRVGEDVVLIGHEGFVTAVDVAPGVEEGTCVVVSGGQDCTARVFKVEFDEKSSKVKESVKNVHKVFRGHDMQINCVAATAQKGDAEGQARLFCTGSDDCTVKIWNLDGGKDSKEDAAKQKEEEEEEEEEEEGRNMMMSESAEEQLKTKKRKQGEELDEDSKAGSAMLTLEGHTQRVTGCCFENPRSLWTCSWDASLKNWDVETGECRESFVGSDTGARTCIAVRKRTDDLDIMGTETTSVIAHGGVDRIVRVWDPREGNAEGGTLILRGHKVCFMFFFSLYLSQRVERQNNNNNNRKKRVMNNNASDVKIITYIL